MPHTVQSRNLELSLFEGRDATPEKYKDKLRCFERRPFVGKFVAGVLKIA